MKRNHYIAALLLPALLMAGTVQATDAGTGVFSVSSTKQVQFATANEPGGATTSSLFLWAGITSLEHDGWRVLTSTEWTHLLVTRDAGRESSEYRNGLGNVNGENGLIILPDEWINPLDKPFKTTYSSEGFGANTYSTAEWTAMELSGAVFLPCKGYSTNGTDITDASDHGTYWSATASSGNYSYRIQFENGSGGGIIHDQTTGAQSNYYSVRLVREVTALNENDESTTFNSKMGNLRGQNSVQIFRTLYKDGSFNTLCLPFNVPSISSSPLNGAEVYTFESGEVVNNVLQLDITQVTSDQLTKGVPYLIRWANDGTILGNMEFTGLIASDWDTDDSADGDAGSTSVKYHGFYYKTHLSDATDGAGNHYNLFLGADDELYWPNDGDNNDAKMKGFRAHFYIVTGGVPTGSPSAAPWRGMPAMLRIVSRDNTVTGTEQVEIQQAVEKAIRDGRIVLIIDGETYNMGGQRL